jgi:UDP-N-acetylmuramate dehydrogenase
VSDEDPSDDGLVVRLAEPLAPHTAWRTGGTCDAYVVAFHEEAAVQAILQCRQAGWAWQMLGATTRTVFRDGPVPGMALRLGGELAHFHIDGTTLVAGAATPVPALVAAAEARGLAGLEAFATTAGSVGSAVLLDDAWEDVVTSVRTIRRDKVAEDSLHAVRKRKNSVVLGVRILLTAEAPGPVQHRTEKLWRAQSPAPACSWFTAPRRGSVRDILHSASLPLVRLRLAAIPDAAPECMVNLGGGTAADLNLLFKSAQDRVKKVRGIDLARAVQWAGTKAST